MVASGTTLSSCGSHIFAGLVALLFIYEAFNKLGKIFKAHPLLETSEYCQAPKEDACSDSATCQTSMQPNIALLSMVLMFSTFLIAYALKVFRNSQFLDRRFRRALGDFGVPIAIAAMLLVDWVAGDSITEKLRSIFHPALLNRFTSASSTLPSLVKATL